jgi:signal transduction histidine kinase
MEGAINDLPMVPLSPEDPLSQERFCLLLTADFCLVLVLGDGEDGQPSFRFSFDPTLAEYTWQQIRLRIAQVRPALLATVDSLITQFPPVAPDYRLVTQYSHLLLQRLRHQAPPPAPSPVVFAAAEPAPRREILGREGFASLPASSLGPALAVEPAAAPAPDLEMGSDTELLKAMAHEIRTPLTTIRTLTRSLLKRKDVTEEVSRRLRSIDRECTQQIDRFNLIFRAVELETETHQQPKSPLSAFPLDHLFQEAIPLWQQQASRRNHTLTVTLPPHLPLVNSDPTMLNQVLTGLIDRFTHSLPPYSHIELAVTLAGHQLKLQFQSQPPEADANDPGPNADTLLSSPFKALGQLLIFQPETGGLSLNLHATKNLFQSLGGKLIVRQRPQAGEVLTVFLPLETRTL